MRIPWSQDEAALLVDAYYRTECGEFSIHAAVHEMSQLLRLMAVNKGIRIDDKYRNANGIGMQMQFVKRVATQSKTGLTNGSKLLKNMVGLRAKDRKAFDLIMEGARRSLSGSVEPEFNQELSLVPNLVLREPVAHYDAEEESHMTQEPSCESFSTWVSRHIPENDQARMLQTFSSLGMFCRKAGIIQVPMASIADTDEVARIKQVVFSNKALNIHSRKLLADFKHAITLYAEYLTAVKRPEVIIRSDAPIEQPIPTDTPVETAGSTGIDEHRFVDFSGKGNYAHTNPIYATYRSERLEPIRTWKDVYIWIIGRMLRDYPDIVLGILGRPIVGRGECADVDDPKSAGKMRSPVIVSGKIAVETSFSASDLLNRLGALIRICNLDASHISVAYSRRKASTEETNAKAPAQHPDNLLSIDFSRRTDCAYCDPFYVVYGNERLDSIKTWKHAYVWIVNHLLRDYPETIRQYIDKPITGRGAPDIRKASDKPVMRNASELNQGLVIETGFSASDLMNRAGILLRFCKVDLSNVNLAFAKHSQQPDKPKAADLPKDDHPKRINLLLEPIRSVIAECFPNGIRFASIIDRNKLKRAYIAKFSDNLPDSDSDLSALLREAGILHGDKVYVLTDEQKEKIRDTMWRLFDEGNHVICYSELLIHQAALLEECHLYDVTLIRAVLQELLPEAICDEAWILAYEGASIIEDITHAFGEDIKLNYVQIKERCPYIEIGLIKSTLSRSDRFVWTQYETFAQTDLIQLAQDEVDQVQCVFLPKMQADGFASLNQLPLQESCDLNPDVSFMAVRDTMYIRHMAFACSKNGVIATPKGKMISSYDLMTAYCRSVDHATMDDLDDYERDLTGRHASLILHAACYHMVRIDHDHFVSDESISFDVDAVDHAIGLFVGDRIVPITAVSSFTSFPDVDGYEWNLYLVESFLRRFSRRYSIDGGPAQSSYVGGICPRAMRFESYEDRLAVAIIQDAVPLDEEAIGRYLTRKKFVLRRSATVKTVRDKALKIQEQRGTARV